jgi:TIR domain
MQRALGAGQIIAVLSPDFARGIQTQSEWIHGLRVDERPDDGRAGIILVKVKGGDLPSDLRSLKYLDLVGVEDESVAQRRLLGTVLTQRRPHIVPPFPGSRHEKDEVSYPGNLEPKTPGNINVSHDNEVLLILYATGDKLVAHRLALHLRPLEREGHVPAVMLYNLETDNWEDGTSAHREAFRRVKILVPIISADLLVLDRVNSPEIIELLADAGRHGDRLVLPVISRASDWRSSPFGRFTSSPRDGRPISERRNLDGAIVEATANIRRAARKLVDSATTYPQESTSTQIDKLHTAGSAKPKTSYKLSEVFKKSGVPTVTFVEPSDFFMMKLALEQPGRGVVIEGPSGIGKTSVLRKAITQLGDAGVPYELLTARNPGDVTRLGTIQSWHRGVVAVDDFHRLNPELQVKLVDYMKYLADIELEDRKLVVVGIPGTRSRLIETAFDLATRIDIFTLTSAPESLILTMIEKGEKALNIRFAERIDIAQESRGSLNIAQMLCFYLAAHAGIFETQSKLSEIDSDTHEAINKVISYLALKFYSVVAAFASVGEPSDHIGIHLLEQLAKSGDGTLHLPSLKSMRPSLTRGIDRFLAKNHILTVAEKAPDYQRHIVYDHRSGRLAFDDPQLAFYLTRTAPAYWEKEVGKLSEVKQNRIFVSYSHHDLQWLVALKVHLKPLERSGVIDLWDDTRINSGNLWRDDIAGALESARVAVLLVSAHFLASDFIVENELPPLLASAEALGTTIVPIQVSPSRFEDTPQLSRFQSANSPSLPLISMSTAEQELLFVKVSKEIQAALNRTP